MAPRGKARRPSMHGDVLPRDRVTSLVVEALEASSYVAVVASAGSGKTTAVAQALDTFRSPVAWVELDERDQAPGRLLTYLQEAVQHVVHDLPDVLGPALSATDSQPEAAGSLAESLSEDGLVIVLDNVEQILASPPAVDVLANFVRFVRPSTRIVLISRDKLPDALRRHFVGGRGAVLGDADLAVTTDEAEELLGKWGRSGVDAESAVEATNGWIMGLRLESWRLPGHVYGVGGESDALSGYLAVEIFAALTQDERDLLVRTSVLDEVTLVKAEVLGCPNAAAAFGRLTGRPMPMTTFNSGMSIRYHPRFRQYLQTQFQLLPLEQQRHVFSAFGRMLVAEQRHEDAVEPLLRAGEVEEASYAAAVAAPAVLDRLDFALVESWLASLGPVQVRANADLLAADVRVACELEQYDRGADSADRLLDLHAERRGTHVTSALAVAAAWCFFLVSRIDDARRFLAIGPNTADCRLMAFLIGVELVDDPTHYSERPPACGGVVDGLLARADLAHGRFREVLAEEVRPWTSVRSSRVAAMRYLGMTEQAADSVQHLELANWPRVRIYADIMVDCGRPQEAWAALLQGRELRARTGSNLYRMFELLDEAAIALRFNNDVSFALAAIREVEQEPTADRRIRILEQLHLWKGLAALIQDDAELAATELRSSVGLMVRWDRLLWLPTAAVYLAEAEWRLDNLDAADAAADLALHSAERQGSRHLLIEALREFPAVVSRRLDAETDLDSAWHELGRNVLSPSVPGWEVARPRVTVLEMGTQSILVDGQIVQPKLSKSIELLSFLAAHGRRVSRAVLQEALFAGSSEDADGAYLRLAVNGLRKVLPKDAPLRVEDGIIAWEGEGLASESAQIEASVTRLSHLPSTERRAAAYQQLAVLAKGDYLPSCKSEWAERRRDRIALMALDVKEVLSDLAYQAGDYREADALVWQVLDDAPHRERSWRLAMRIASAMGADDRVLDIFRQCADAMSDLGTEPSAATRQVAAKLRGVASRS